MSRTTNERHADALRELCDWLDNEGHTPGNVALFQQWVRDRADKIGVRPNYSPTRRVLRSVKA